MRTSQKNTDAVKVGELFHINIFGKLIPTSQNNNVNSNVIQGKLNVPLNNVEKRLEIPKHYVPSSLNERPLKAIYPVITSEAFAETMDKYRLYVYNLNASRREENKVIEKYNEEYKKVKFSEAENIFKTVFIKKYKSLTAKFYNEKVEEFSKDKGIYLQKKKLHIIKYQSELVFQNILHEYASQLKENTKVFKDLGLIYDKPVKQLEINSYKIISKQRNGIKSIEVTNETIKNHRKHLLDAGVFFDYSFCGHKRGVKVHVNCEILTVFDLHTQKITTVENQHVKERTAKSFGNSKEVTVTESKNNNIKENVNNISLGLGTASPDNSFVFYNNTRSKLEEGQTGGAKKSVKFSENLEKIIENDIDFANKLAAHKFNKYVPIDIRYLYHESKCGTLSREQFKEIIIQDFFKSAARLYQKSTPFFGSWLNAYKSWIDNKFLVNGNLYNKELMVDKLQEYRWRLNHASKWFTKYEVRPLFPNQYFDFTRTNPKEIGFEYTKKAYMKHKADVQNRIDNENVVILNAKKRKERINYSKKFDLVINRFMNNRISLNDTFDYIKNNLPDQFKEKFTDKLMNYSTRKSLKN